MNQDDLPRGLGDWDEYRREVLHRLTRLTDEFDMVNLKIDNLTVGQNVTTERISSMKDKVIEQERQLHTFDSGLLSVRLSVAKILGVGAIGGLLSTVLVEIVINLLFRK